MDTLDDENTSSVESEVSDNDDVFEHAQYDREEDSLLRRGMMKQNLPSKNAWSFHSFSLRSSKFVGSLKTTVAI